MTTTRRTALSLVVVAAGTAVAGDSLPQTIDPNLSAETDPRPRIIGDPVVLGLQLVATDDRTSLLPSIRAGAVGYPTGLPATIHGVMAGEAALSRRPTFRLLE